MVEGDTITRKVKADIRKRSVVPTDYVRVLPITKSLRFKVLNAIGRLTGVKLSDMIAKTKSVQAKYVFDDHEVKLRRPDHDYYSLVELAVNSWVIRRTFNKIIRECLKNWGNIQPRFKFKCKKCEREYQSEVDKCDCGAGKTELRKPKNTERARLVKIIKQPSANRDFMEFVRTSMFYSLAVDELYWSVLYDTLETETGVEIKGKEVHIEHPGYIVLP
jgi:hypothetical protein